MFAAHFDSPSYLCGRWESLTPAHPPPFAHYQCRQLHGSNSLYTKHCCTLVFWIGAVLLRIWLPASLKLMPWFQIPRLSCIADSSISIASMQHAKEFKYLFAHIFIVLFLGEGFTVPGRNKKGSELWAEKQTCFKIHMLNSENKLKQFKNSTHIQHYLTFTKVLHKPHIMPIFLFGSFESTIFG